MKKVRINIAGQKFGRLTVIKYAYTIKKIAFWLCKCECGNEKIVRGNDLRRGKIKSCGCFRKDNLTTHKLTHSKLYRIWANLKKRCNDTSYKYYGGRGITVCPEWQNDFMNFYDWAINNGYDENAKRGECTIDRIDVNGNYEPLNCRWVDYKTQMNNTRFNHLLEFEGQIHTTSEWAKIKGINRGTIYSRLKLGWSIEKTLTQTIQKHERRKRK